MGQPRKTASSKNFDRPRLNEDDDTAASSVETGSLEKRSLISGEFSFARNVSKDDWKMKLRLRSSSPDLICFNDFKFSLVQEGCPLSFIASLLESQV